MTTFTFPPTFIGFDRLISDIESFHKVPTYPPHNVIAIPDMDAGDSFLIEVAVAGFSKQDLSVEEFDQSVVVTGRVAADKPTDGRMYIHRALSKRPFELRFKKAPNVKVIGVDLQDGILSVSLEADVVKPNRTVHSIK